jgi:hypothetical protein
MEIIAREEVCVSKIKNGPLVDQLVKNFFLFSTA